MGFVKIASVNDTTELDGIWNEYFDASKLVLDNISQKFEKQIENGTRIFLANNQALVLFSGELFVDYCVGPGALLCEISRCI